MKFDPSCPPTTPTPEQLAELGDALGTGTELVRLYEALTRHPLILATPGSGEVFLVCHAQAAQDMVVIREQLGSLLFQAGSATPDPAGGDDLAKTVPLAAPPVSLPDVEPPDPNQSVHVAVKRIFHLEDFLLQQLNFSLVSAQQRHHLKLELQLKMILLSTRQRCSLLEERYGFARSKSGLVRGLRRQTTRLLSRLQGEERHDID